MSAANANASIPVKIVCAGQIRRFLVASYAALRTVLSDNYAAQVAEGYQLTFRDDEGDYCVLTNDSEFREAMRILNAAAGANASPQNGAALKLWFQPKPNANANAAAAKPAAAPAPAANVAAAPVKPAAAPAPAPAKPAAAKPAAAPAPAPAKPAAAKPTKPAAPAAAKLAAAAAAAPKAAPKPKAAPAPAAEPLAPVADAAAAVAVHDGVTCDGCGVKPIRGARYKCTTCPDFDYCEKCEESAAAKHDASHVFLKLRQPRVRPQQPTAAQRQAAQMQRAFARIVATNPWLAGQIEAVEVTENAPAAGDAGVVSVALNGAVNVDAVLAGLMPQVVAKGQALKQAQAQAQKEKAAAAAAPKADVKADAKAAPAAAPKPKAAAAPAAGAAAAADAGDAKAKAAKEQPNAARQDRELAALRELGFTHDQMLLRALLTEARARTKSNRKRCGNVAWVAAKLTDK